MLHRRDSRMAVVAGHGGFPSVMRGTQYASSSPSPPTLVMTTRVHSASGSTWQSGYAIYKGLVVIMLANHTT